MVEQTLPTLSQLKKAIPEKCFQVRTRSGDGRMERGTLHEKKEIREKGTGR
jgi:hypothetical protein